MSPVYSALDAADDDDSSSQFSPFPLTDGHGDRKPSVDSGLRINKHAH